MSALQKPSLASFVFVGALLGGIESISSVPPVPRAKSETGTPLPLKAVQASDNPPPRRGKDRRLNASLRSIAAGLKPVLQDEEGKYFQFPNGQIRRQTGKGHSKAERKARRQEKAERTAGIVNEAQLKREYAKWRADMTPAERAAARKLKCLMPLADGGIPKGRRGQEVDLDFHDPADLPEAAEHRTAVDELEPLDAFSVAIENLDYQEVTNAAETFGAGLSWTFDVADQSDMVVIGDRGLATIYLMRPDLVKGAERTRAQKILGCTQGAWPKVPWGGECFQCLATGDIFGRVFEWIRRGESVSQIGERLCLVAYVVRPTIMGSPTLQQLGEKMNKTRQAKDKLASCLRDTFAGIRAAAQRGEFTRDKCIAAH